MDIKKAHKGLIDATGRRKYFRQLNPVLLDNPVEIDIQSIKKKQKVLFIMPNFHWIDEDVNALWDLFPWNLCQMAAMIEGICSDVKIIDAYKENLSKDQLKQEIKKFKPDIVGLTVLMDQYGKAAHMAAHIVKNVSKNIINVIGGVYATANPKRIMKDNLSFQDNKRTCPLSNKDSQIINYKDIKLLSRYISEKGKIIPRRITNVSNIKQRELSKAIKRARFLALMSYTKKNIKL